MNDAAVWAERARRWIGTPYVHQAACRGAGCDCLGLVRGLWLEAFGAEPELVPPYSADWSEPQNDELLWQAAARLLRPVDLSAMQSGNVILFRMRAGAVAKHLGIAGVAGAADAVVRAGNLEVADAACSADTKGTGGVIGVATLAAARHAGAARRRDAASQVAAMPTFIHAYSGHGVVESPLSAPWRRRIVACFAFPERVG
jgi:NlpC/P60 family putative phage cell wall peptidase